MNDIISFGRKVIKIPSHPNILKVIYMGQAIVRNEKIIYHIMEYVSNGNLRDLIYSHSDSHYLADKIKIFKKVCDGLYFAHNLTLEGELGSIETGIIHGDIKPSNILISDDLEPKLADFMSVDFYLIEREDERIHNDLLQRNPTRAIGTLNYMAPEQLATGRINFKTDIYSLGILLFELLTLKKPEFGVDMIAILDEIEYIEQPTRDRLSKVIFTCLQVDPSKRYNSVKEILLELDSI